MKKFIYTLLPVLGLLIIIGFTSSHIKNMHCTKEKLHASAEEFYLNEDVLHGQGVYQPLTTDSLYTDIRVANYQLASGSYFNWQSTPGGRMIIVVDGEGYYQSKGKEIVRLQKGDRIETTAGLYHWIGATPDSELEFISVTSQKSDELINWHEPLTASEYKQAANAE